jgi:protein phosphatase
MLTRAVGVMEELVVDSGQLTIHDGDIFLLATDGLMKHVEDTALTHILRENAENPAQALLNAALAAGGRDNITVVVVSLT